MSLAMSTTANPAAALQSALSEAEKQSSLLSARRVLDEQTPALRELGQDPSLGLLELGDESRKGAIDAIVLNEEAAELVTLMAKLKSHYLEQRTKYLYVSQIVADPEEVEFPSNEQNDELRAENEQAKARLKDAKRQLAARMEDLQRKTGEVAAQLARVQASARSLSNVTKQTLDTRVSLARLRAAHPAPRLTTSSALALLGTQEGTMQALQDELDRAADRKEELKADVEERTRAVGRLGVRRAEVEREARAAAAARGGRGEAERRVAEYVEWLSGRLALTKSLTSTHTLTRTQDTINVTYHLPSRASNPAFTAKTPLRELSIELAFAGEPPRLTSADVVGLEEEEEEQIADVDRWVREDDPLGLVRHVVALAS